MKTPRTIKAIAVVDQKTLKIKPMDLYNLKDVNSFSTLSNELVCEVEISFLKYIKRNKKLTIEI